MLYNYLSTSGTVQGVQGNDAKAPAAYWEQYTYHPVTSGELSGLINGDIYSTALSLSAGEYTCLEISFDEPVYVGQVRCYLGSEQLAEVTLSYQHTTENPSEYKLLVESGTVSRENVRGSALYYDRIDSSRGYIEGEAIPLTVGEYVQLISATYFTSVSGNPSVVQTGFENKTIKQIVEPTGDGSVFTRISLTTGSSQVNLDNVSIAPVDVQEETFDFSSGTQDDDRRDELRWWYSDEASLGHFEGRIIPLDVGSAISGTWEQQVTWSGVGSREERSDLAGHTIRQTLPATELEHLGDGVRVTLRGGTEDVHVKYMSYMPSNSTEFRLEFGSSLDIYQENLKHDIEQWHNDGSDEDSWEAQLSRHRGHFESYEVDIDNAAAIMYSENVIGIPATSHGLSAGDYIRIEGTTYYDGYYYILTYSTPHIIVIWGIYDPEVFTTEAKIRRVVSLGPEYDDYGVKPDCRGVVPFVEVNFVTGDKSYILSYEDSGKLHNSVFMGPDETDTAVVSSIYDITIDDGWLCNSPGPATTPDFQQSVPDQRAVAREATTSDDTGGPDQETVALVNALYRLRIPAESNIPEGRWPDRYYYDDTKATPDIGYHAGGYGWKPGDLWTGKMTCITESQDPEYEGDLTGWGGVPMLFDRKMAQPWWTLISLADCPWITMSYRGPIPVKFILDMGNPRLMSKYRYWIQTVICPEETTIGWPKSWKVEASNHGDNEQDWVLLEHVVDYSMANYSTSLTPPDERVPGTCAEGEWSNLRNVELYRYYRFNVYESWTCSENPGKFECSHIDEIDFVEHRCSAGIFPTIIETPLYMDVVGKIIPDEHLRGDSQIFYALSFDDGQSFEVYLSHVDYWRTIAKYEDDKWQYFDGLIWREMDSDKPQENTVRFALWHAFSVRDNRMDAELIQAIPESAYAARLPEGGYVKFAVGLTSSSQIEAMLKGITVSGTVFNPTGSDVPTELTFSGGQHGCIVPAYGTVTSDWINDDLPGQRDALFVMDLDTTASSIPYYNYTEGYKYFYRNYVGTYDLQEVDVNDYILASGVALIDSVEVRQSDTVTFPASTHNLPTGAYVRVSGTYSHYDGYHYVDGQRPGSFDVKSKHWTLDTPVPSGAYVQRRYSVGPGNMQPHTQVGSILQFKETGGYYDSVASVTDSYPYYWVDSTVVSPGQQAHNLFDPDTSTEFHSGQPISYGPVSVGLHLDTAKSYDKFRIRASTNDFYWEFEHPYEVVFGASALSDPDLESDGDWDVLSSGVVNLSIGPGRFSDWNTCTVTGTYQHYRFKVLSNRGQGYDCLRANCIEIGNDDEVMSGYTLVDVEPGFASPYLFDDSAYSEYVSTTSGFPAVHLDFRQKPRSISAVRLRASKGFLYGNSHTYNWQNDFPQVFQLAGSNITPPSLYNENHWDPIASFIYAQEDVTSYMEGQWLPWRTISSGVSYDPYRHYRIKFLTNQSMDAVTQTFDVPLTSSFPYTLLTLPVGGLIYNITAEVRQPDPDVGVWDIAKGGYSSQHATLGPDDNIRHLVNPVGAIRWDYYPLTWGRYITQVGQRCDSPVGGSRAFSLVRTDGSSFTAGGSLASVSYSSTTGVEEQWFACPTPRKIPTGSSSYISVNTTDELSFEEDIGVMHWYLPYGGYWSPSYGERPNITVRYGNLYHIGDADDNERFISDFQPYGSTEESEWAGDYGPYATDKDIKIYRDSIAADTEGVIRVTVTYLPVSESNVPVRMCEAQVTYSEELRDVTYVSFSGSLPLKLMDLPPWHKTTGGMVRVTEGFQGGYAEQEGYVGTGTFDNSFWTIVDKHWQLDNSRAIAQVGIYADTPTTISLKLFKVRSSEWFDISEIQQITHSGTGFEWHTLLQPHLIPDDGTYHLGWYQPNYPVKMGDGTGANSVSYQYGDYTGTNINLPLYNAMRPCLAVRYTSCFTIGMYDTDDVYGTFSPSLTERIYPFEKSFGPYLTPKSIYLYSDCTMTSGDTQGAMVIDLNHIDTNAGTYGASEFTVRDNNHIEFDRTSRNLLDGSRSTDFYSYRDLQSAEPLFYIARFHENVRLIAFRYRPGSDPDEFPVAIDVIASQDYQNPFSTLEWDELYTDQAYLAGSAPDYWGPWVYIDDYLGSYRYYGLKMTHYESAEDVATLGDVEFLIEYNRKVWVVVPELYNAVHELYDEGMLEKDVKVRSHAGESRELQSIYDTFSSYGKNEMSPGTYFYRGENTPWGTNPHPTSVTKKEGNLELDVEITHPFFAGMNILAWHPLTEPTGNFEDQSGNNVTAIRVGTVSSRMGRHGLMAANIEDDSVDGNIRFTLPHHLEEYTVAFWYSPNHKIYSTYPFQYDIMGGWISYGAIPGNWHVSMSKQMMYEDEPYPYLQEHGLQWYPEIQLGRMAFGNYGAHVETSRYYWHINTWYHVVFSFHPNATETNPYKVWINGVRDETAQFFGYDNGRAVYPPSDVIMVDPDDIHYDTHAKHNCMYFGLPLEDGAGTLYEHALQHVMHFNKVLTDEEVFKLYRMKTPLSEEWDGIYFPDTEEVESPGRIIVDLGSPKVVTRYGLIVPSGSVDDVWFRLTGSGSSGETIIDERYASFETLPDLYNVLNPEAYQHYVLEFLGSSDKADYLFINGLRLVDVPHIPTVSGTYETVTSGTLEKSTILSMLPSVYTPESSQINFSVSRDLGQSWWAMISGTWTLSGTMTYDEFSSMDKCDFDLLGSGTLYTKHEFTSNPILMYPAVTGIDTRQTDWITTVSATEITITGAIGANQTNVSDWFRYAQDQSTHHILFLEFSSSNGNPSYTDDGPGHIIDATYTCSGLYLLSEMEGRKNDVVSLKASSMQDVEHGNLVGIQDAGPYNGYWTVASGFTSDLWIYAPYEPYQVTGGAEYRRVIPSALNTGAEIVMPSGVVCLLSSSGSVVTISEDMGRQEIEAVYDSVITEHGLQPTREIRTNEVAGVGTDVIRLNLTSNSGTNYRVFESTEDSGLYKVFDGSIEESHSINRAVVDLGEPTWVNSYRWFYGYTTTTGVAPDYWEVYVTNELPFWEQVAAVSGTSLENWAWSQNYDLPTTSGYQYYLFKFYEDVDLREIELLRKDVMPSIDHCITVTSGWNYSDIGRLSKVRVNSYEPENTYIFHGVTFDGGNSYCIFDNNAWESVVQLNGSTWQYKDTSWHNASENTVYGACRDAIEEASQLFSTTQLEEVEEMEWHGSGAVESTSGTIGFIQYMYSPTINTPTLQHYEMLYQALPSGITSLIGEGYSYSTTELVTAGSGTHHRHIFSPETSTEVSYGRKLVQVARVYISEGDVSELAVLDVQTPDDGYYLATQTYLTQDDPIYVKKGYYSAGDTTFYNSLGRQVCTQSGIVYGVESGTLKKLQLSDFSVSSLGLVTVTDKTMSITTSGGDVWLLTPGSGIAYCGITPTTISGMPLFSTNEYADFYWIDSIHMLKYGDQLQLWNVMSGAWELLDESPGPLPRHNASSIYDPDERCIWMYGGYYVDSDTGEKHVYGDFWKYDLHLRQWSQISPMNNPGYRYGAALSLSPEEDCIYLYGGYGLSDTWVFDKRWNTWAGMTEVWGLPSLSAGGSDRALLYWEDNKHLLVGGGQRINQLSLPEVTTMTGVAPRYFLGEITDEHIRTGGLLLNEGEFTVFSLADVPASKKIYYAEMRVYFDPELGSPSSVTPSGIDDRMMISNWKQHENYLSSFIWSDLPVESMAVPVSNSGTEGPKRVTEFELHPITYSGVWNVEDVFNLIEQSHTTTLSGVEGYPQYRFQGLSTPHLERLIYEVESAVPILPGYGIATESNFYEFGGKSQEVRAYIDTSSGVEAVFYTRVSGAAVWNTCYPTWNGDSFSYLFHEPTNVTDLRIVLGNGGGIGELETISYSTQLTADDFYLCNLKNGVYAYRYDEEIYGHFMNSSYDFVAVSGLDMVGSGTRINSYYKIDEILNTTSGSKDFSLYPRTGSWVFVNTLANLYSNAGSIQYYAGSHSEFNALYSTKPISISNWAHISSVAVGSMDQADFSSSTISGSYSQYYHSQITPGDTYFHNGWTFPKGKVITHLALNYAPSFSPNIKFKLVKDLGSNTWEIWDAFGDYQPRPTDYHAGYDNYWIYELPKKVYIPEDGDYYLGFISDLKIWYCLTATLSSWKYTYFIDNTDAVGVTSSPPTVIGYNYEIMSEAYYRDISDTPLVLYAVSFDGGVSWKIKGTDLYESNWTAVVKNTNGNWSYLDEDDVWVSASRDTDAWKLALSQPRFWMQKYDLENFDEDDWHDTGGFTRGESSDLRIAAVMNQPESTGESVVLSDITVNYELYTGAVDATYEDIRWLRAVQLINCGDEIDFGTTGSGENTLELPTYYTDYNKISIFNNNRSGTHANARVLPRFSGDYHLDRTIRISEDVVHWYTVEDGLRMPEDYPWEMGKFENTRVSEDQILLEGTSISGSWRSPVIEVLDPSSTAAYVYVKNVNYDQSYVAEDYTSINNIIKVRTGLVKPMQVFLATAVNSDQQLGIQAPWKMTHFKSDGNPVTTFMERSGQDIYYTLNKGALDVVESNAPRRYWTSTEPYLWQFYGALDSRGFAGVSLGVHWEGYDFSELDRYLFYRGFPSNTGQTFPRATWGYQSTEIHAFDVNWLMLPIFNQALRYVSKKEGGIVKKAWHAVDVVYRPEPFYELYQEQYYSDKIFHARNLYMFPGASNTPVAQREIDYLYSFEGTLTDLENDGIRCAACPDNIVHESVGHYYWLHYACNYETVYYKTLLVNGQNVEKEFDHIERKFNFMVEAGEGAPTRGFWGITQTGVYWYKFDGVNLTEEFGVTADNIASFKRLHHGSVDFQNNLWFVDMATERVIRVNFKTQSVDYSRVVQGAASVACDPFDGSAYIYVVRPEEFLEGDAIKIVHIGDYDYLEPEVVCQVPGPALLDSFNVNLITRSTTPAGYYDVLPEDPYWGEGEGSLPWINYSAAAPILPKGIYKQFKLTLRREDLEAASPEVEYLRIPAPAIINKIPWKGYKDIFVDTIPRQQNYDLAAGTHTLDLLVWWTRE